MIENCYSQEQSRFKRRNVWRVRVQIYHGRITGGVSVRSARTKWNPGCKSPKSSRQETNVHGQTLGHRCESHWFFEDDLKNGNILSQQKLKKSQQYMTMSSEHKSKSAALRWFCCPPRINEKSRKATKTVNKQTKIHYKYKYCSIL